MRITLYGDSPAVAMKEAIKIGSRKTVYLQLAMAERLQRLKEQDREAGAQQQTGRTVFVKSRELNLQCSSIHMISRHRIHGRRQERWCSWSARDPMAGRMRTAAMLSTSTQEGARGSDRWGVALEAALGGSDHHAA